MLVATSPQGKQKKPHKNRKLLQSTEASELTSAVEREEMPSPQEQQTRSHLMNNYDHMTTILQPKVALRRVFVSESH